MNKANTLEKKDIFQRVTDEIVSAGDSDEAEQQSEGKANRIPA